VTPALYRSILPRELPPAGTLLSTFGAPRPPINVPNIVDNLWEWARPAHYACRRYAAFASSSPELAQANGPAGGVVCRVEFDGEARVCRLRGLPDARLHADCIALPILLYDHLGSHWLAAALAAKLSAGRLWLPCLAADEVERVFAEDGRLAPLRSSLAAAIGLWRDVELLDAGAAIGTDEVFFEARRYRLLDV
jgi:hypothetical protein